MRTYRINERGKVVGIRRSVIRVVDPRDVCHQTEATAFVWQLVQGILEVRRRDQADENIISNDGQTSIKFASPMQQLQFDSQAGSWDNRGVGDVYDPLLTDPRHNVGQVRRENRLVFVVEEGI
jgi:hypothetical protein